MLTFFFSTRKEEIVSVPIQPQTFVFLSHRFFFPIVNIMFSRFQT